MGVNSVSVLDKGWEFVKRPNKILKMWGVCKR